MELNLSSMNLQLRFARSYSHSAGWHQKRTWTDYTAYFIRSGSVTIQVQDLQGAAGPGDVIVLFPGDYGVLESAQGCSFLLLCFRVEAGNYHHLLFHINCAGIYTGMLAEVGERMLSFFPDGRDPLSFSARQYAGLTLFLAELLECSGKHVSFHRPAADYADWKLNQLLSDMDNAAPAVLPIRELANRMEMSEKYFIHYFRTQVGRTPGQYMNHQRMMVALQLLSDTALTLEEVAQRVHYADAYSFSKAFRKCFGESPGSFRGHLI